MTISLEEQIEYMRAEVRYWETRLQNAEDYSKAILATLEAVKEYSDVEKSGICRHGVPLDWNCNACSDSGNDERKTNQSVDK